MVTTFNGWTHRGGHRPRRQRPIATFEDILGALRKAKAEVPEGESPNLDRLIELARKYCQVPTEYYKTSIRRQMSTEERVELGIPLKKTRDNNFA